MTIPLHMMSDSYKHSHWKMYPENMTNMYSYFESRGGEFQELVFFGIKHILKEMEKGFEEGVPKNYPCGILRQHLGKDIANIDAWYSLYAQSSLPLRIKAVPEGTIVAPHNVLMTVESTDSRYAWLVNFVEALLVQVWYPTTVATLSHSIRNMIAKALLKSGTLESLPYRLHDFGVRGASSMESAAIGGAAHLTQFAGTDNLPALYEVVTNYQGKGFPWGFSIPATEHSTICSWGRQGELDAYRNLLEQFPNSPVACVSDSYDLDFAVRELWGTELRDQILQREHALVVRPDSGNPLETVLRTLINLEKAFGTTVNDKGFKVLPPQVRVIQGDGVNKHSIQRILDEMICLGYSADNISFGMGGALLQSVTRDTCKFAFKCSEVTVDGVPRPVFKDPKTDPGKRSKAGRLKLVQYMLSDVADSPIVTRTVSENDAEGIRDLLETVYDNGFVGRESNFSDIRERSGWSHIIKTGTVF